MHSHRPILPLLPALLLPFLAHPAFADAVSVKVEKVTFQIATKPEGPRGAPAPDPDNGNYALRNSQETVTPDTVEVIKLNNGLVEAWVCPAYGARVLRAFDPKTKAEYFYWGGDRNEDYIGWGTGGVEPSYPFFEHGVRLRQPAGYRIVKHANGAVTVAMDMRFTQHQKPRDKERYGRFTEESLNVMVTLEPDSSVIAWRQRRENPTPLPRSDRQWNCATYTQPLPTKEEDFLNKKTQQTEKRKVGDQTVVESKYRVIYPARWVVNHGPTEVHTSPHWTSLTNWKVSHFAIDAPYGLIGLYTIDRKLNQLRINDPKSSPGAKLYTGFHGGEGLVVEIWGGQGYVFEDPNKLIPAYAPSEFTNHFYNAEGIGEVTAANTEAAVSVNGTAFELVTTRPGPVRVTSNGKEVASGEGGPRNPIRGTFDGKQLAVIRDGKTLLAQTFPLERPAPLKETPVPPEIQAKFESLRTFKPSKAEMEQVMQNEGVASALGATAEAAKITDASNPDYALSIARTCYRIGALAEAERLAKLCPGPQADFLLGLLALEKGETTDFGKAGVEADYLRAVQKIRAKQPAEALQRVEAHLKSNPTAWRPRLARAFWAKDLQGAKALADENPGSPEAQLVLELLGETGAAKEKATLLANNPEAPEQVEAFRKEIVEGIWTPAKRFAPGVARN